MYGRAGLDLTDPRASPLHPVMGRRELPGMADRQAVLGRLVIGFACGRTCFIGPTHRATSENPTTPDNSGASALPCGFTSENPWEVGLSCSGNAESFPIGGTRADRKAYFPCRLGVSPDPARGRFPRGVRRFPLSDSVARIPRREKLSV